MKCLACLKFLWPGHSKPGYHSIQPASLNATSLIHTVPNQEVVTLMAQVHKSRRSSCCSFRSTRSGLSMHNRRHSEMSQSHFLRIVEKRKKTERISKDAFEMYREVSGVLILGKQLRTQTRRTPPLPAPVVERKKTM